MGGVKMSVHSLPSPSLHYLPWEMRKIWTSCHKIFETSAVENPFFTSSFLFVIFLLYPSPPFYYFSHLLYVISKSIPLKAIFPTFFFSFPFFPLSSYNVIYLIQQIGIILRSCFIICPFLIFNAKYENVHMNLT